jgi:trimeric autotransporter adhesin
MYPLNQLKTLVSCGRDPARSLSLRRGWVLILLALGSFAFSPMAQAVVPPPDGGYPGFNTAEGQNALFSLAGGVWNTALGGFSLFSDTTGGANTAVGLNALRFNQTGTSNTAVGVQALYVNDGDQNCAFGVYALFGNHASLNSAFGWGALAVNDTGEFNNAVGAHSLFSNVDGSSNNALGESALFNNISGAANTAIGDVALASNDVSGAGLGNANTAVGAGALFSNTDGDSNNAVGVNALGVNEDGFANNVLGFDAMADNVSGDGNVAVGDSAGLGNTSGSFNTYLGTSTVSPVDGESDTVRIGDPAFGVACFIGGIFNATSTGGSAVFVNAAGRLGTLTSSARFKDDIKPMDKASESILALHPVTFRYKEQIDAKGTPQFGLVAEEVAKVNPDLVVPDRDGKPYTVRYEAVNAMLLNEFLKEHRTVQDLKSTVARQEELIAKQQEGMAVLTAQLKEQAAKIQRVSAELEVSKPAPQVVENR